MFFCGSNFLCSMFVEPTDARSNSVNQKNIMTTIELVAPLLSGGRFGDNILAPAVMRSRFSGAQYPITHSGVLPQELT